MNQHKKNVLLLPIDDQLINDAKNGDLDKVIDAINNGADIHACDDYALQWACSNGHLDIVKYLIEQGADVHADIDNSLCAASAYGHLDVVKYLMENGADVHARDNYYALYRASAARDKHLDVVEYLVEYIINNDPQYTYRIIQYANDEQKEKYPWLFAADDHGLLGFKHA